MSKKRSDALTALINEIVDIEAEAEQARGIVEERQIEATAARRALDDAQAKAGVLAGLLVATRMALGFIQRRDDIADETIETLIARANGK